MCGSFEEMEAIAASAADYREINTTAVMELSPAAFEALLARFAAAQT